MRVEKAVTVWQTLNKALMVSSCKGTLDTVASK